MMDRSTATTATTVTTTPISVSSNQIHPFLLGHHISTYSTALCADGAHPKATQLPFFTSSNGEGGALLPSFDPAAVVYGNRGKPPQEPELDGYDCESEEGGLEVAEESPKRTASRGSGSKRSRAAEVHNLSEKRRRSRINEKMKALQKLIPNSNKTDKASMLDEAIDYLKHLQMQVQMLSMRNGISLNPSYIPPSLHSPQPPQIRYGSDSSLLLNVGMGMVSLDPSKSSSFTLSNHGATSSHQTLLQNSSNISNPIVSFAMDSLQSEHGFFTLPLVTTQGTYREDAMQDHLNPSDAIRSDEARILSRLNSQEDLSMDQANPVHIQHIQHNLDTQQKYLAAGNAKPENPEV